MNVSVTLEGSEAVQKMLRDMADIDKRDMLRTVAEDAARSIYERTLDGEDERDGRLKPSKRALEGGTTLFRTAKMMTALGVLKVTDEYAEIGFKGSREAQKAWWNHYGTAGPYPIRPKRGKALAFKSGNDTVVVRSVMHPGIPARPFFGISPKNERAIMVSANNWLEAYMRKMS